MSKGKKLGAEDLQAASLLKMKNWISQIDEAERRCVGTWYDIPDGFETWHFVRTGLKTCDRARQLAATLMEMGYQEAPRGVKCVGYEEDRDGGIYLMVPSQIYYMIQERKQSQMRTVGRRVDDYVRNSVANINQGLDGRATVEVTGGTSKVPI